MCMHSDKKHISWKMMFGSCAAWRISNTIVLKNEKRTRTKSWVTHMQFRLHLAISVSMALLRWTQSCIRCVSFPASTRRAHKCSRLEIKLSPTSDTWANVQLIKWFYVSVLNCKLRFANGHREKFHPVSTVYCSPNIDSQFTKLPYEFSLTTVRAHV